MNVQDMFEEFLMGARKGKVRKSNWKPTKQVQIPVRTTVGGSVIEDIMSVELPNSLDQAISLWGRNQVYYAAVSSHVRSEMDRFRKKMRPRKSTHKKGGDLMQG